MNFLLNLLNSKKSNNNNIVRFAQFCALTSLVLASLTEAALADLTIIRNTDSTTLGNALTGRDVSISNVIISQGTVLNQIGVFTGGDIGGTGPVLGIADGVVLVTGDVRTADGPNTSISTTSGAEVGPTDSSLASIETGTQHDTVSLQFDVVPAGNTLSIDFIFASEEYNEFVCTVFNDAMGIFVSGPGITGEVNIARLDSNLANFSINQINGGVPGSASSFAGAPCSLDNSAFFVDNVSNSTNPNETPYEGNTPAPAEVQNNYTNVEYDGFTVPLASQVQVQPGQTYTVKVVTADIGDGFWDGGVFIDVVESFDLDYGDAPNSYGTSSVNGAIQLPGAARHSIDSAVYLGSTPPDAEGDGTPATSPNPANSDDNTGNDDEDAFGDTLTVFSGITSHAISNIPVNNASGQAAQLMGWIDFNRDGDFLDAGEQAAVDVAPNQTTADLNWSGFSATTTGNTYARFRITTDENLTSSPSPVGLAEDGEVEDYQVAIVPVDYSDTPADGGTAPNGSGTTGYGDATHIIVSGTQLGANIDAEGAAQNSANADGDDNDGTDDEDGITIPALTQGKTVTITADVSGTGGYLQGWIDWDGNGSFDAGEQIATDLQDNGTEDLDSTDGTVSFNVSVPATAIITSNTYARFRWSTTQGLDTVTTASDGEVEDYAITIQEPTIYDYGDAPDTGVGTGTGNYQTRQSDGGAAQAVIDTPGQVLSLGNEVDVDNGSLQNSNADADDNDGIPDDEDGVSDFPSLTATEGQTYTVSVSARNNVSVVNLLGVGITVDAYLVGYIDFNQDGDFEDPGERSNTVTVGSDAVGADGALRNFDLTFTTPADIVSGVTYARFRLSQDLATAESPIGTSDSSDNGEVEDYQIIITPDLTRTACNGRDIAELSFTNPLLEPNTGADLQPGAVYRFSNVATGIDALVEIEQFNNGASLVAIDNAAAGTANAFQPTLDPASSDSSVDFIVSWVLSGTNIPISIFAFNASGIDIDGDNVALREYIQLNNFSSYFLENPTELTATYDSATATGQFESKTPAVQDGININATTNIVTAEYTDVSSFRYRIGAIDTGSGATNRLNSLNFECIPFNNPQENSTASDPNLILVKRITAINPGRENEIRFNTFVDDGIADNEDNQPNWPDGDDTYLPGVISVSNIQPGDEIEYTIYFLSNGDGDANNVQICDVIPDNMSFVDYGFDNDFGIALLNSSAPGATATNLSNAADTDEGTFYVPGTALPTITVGEPPQTKDLCQKVDSTGATVGVNTGNNINGAVVVELDNVPKADNPGDPVNSYGFIRFRARVQ